MQLQVKACPRNDKGYIAQNLHIPTLMSFWTHILLALLLATYGTGIIDGPASAHEVVPASEILSRITKGESVYYANAKIVGDLNTGSLPQNRLNSTLRAYQLHSIQRHLRWIES